MHGIKPITLVLHTSTINPYTPESFYYGNLHVVTYFHANFSSNKLSSLIHPPFD
jgi:hypothetical protein